MIDKNHYIIKDNGNKLYVHILHNRLEAPNIIYIQTPIGSVTELKECYLPLSKYGLMYLLLIYLALERAKGN